MRASDSAAISHRDAGFSGYMYTEISSYTTYTIKRKRNKYYSCREHAAFPRDQNAAMILCHLTNRRANVAMVAIFLSSLIMCVYKMKLALRMWKIGIASVTP